MALTGHLLTHFVARHSLNFCDKSRLVVVSLVIVSYEIHLFVLLEVFFVGVHVSRLGQFRGSLAFKEEPP